MTVVASSTNESALQRELGHFHELFVRLVNAILNRIFDLRPESATRRRTYLIFLFFFAGFLITLTHENYSVSRWTQSLQEVFWYLLIPSYAATYPGNAVENFIRFAWAAFTDPYTLQYVPILLASFFIALQSGALYLADVFELEDVRVARRFIRAVALSGSNETIRVSQGEIAGGSRESPTYLIGGPGKVIVDLDSAALFEKPDGTPRVIGPTEKEQAGKVTLDGFERFRQGINLRDHFIPLRDQDDKSRSVTSRSLDGIPVSAIDVQVIFSIFRDNKNPTDAVQYPHSKKAVEQLVYSSTSKVTPDSPQSSSHVFIWENIALGMVRSELSKFMSTKKLTEYLASFGRLEVDKAKKRENAIVEEVRQVLPRSESAPDARVVYPPPPFTPRDQISDLFNQFATEFAKNANRKGIEFRWTGIGTWKTPMEVVSEKHIEAWKLTKENAFRGSDFFITQRAKDAGLLTITGMIQDVPLGTYHGSNLESTDRAIAITSLLKEYQRQLKDIVEFLKKNERRIPPTLVAALAYIFQILTPSHLVYPNPPQPNTEREKQLYDELLRKIGSHEVIAQLIELERRFFPFATREELLAEINRNWDLDIAGNWQP